MVGCSSYSIFPVSKRYPLTNIPTPIHKHPTPGMKISIIHIHCRATKILMSGHKHCHCMNSVPDHNYFHHLSIHGVITISMDVLIICNCFHHSWVRNCLLFFILVPNAYNCLQRPAIFNRSQSSHSLTVVHIDSHACIWSDSFCL